MKQLARTLICSVNSPFSIFKSRIKAVGLIDKAPVSVETLPFLSVSRFICCALILQLSFHSSLRIWLVLQITVEQSYLSS